MITNPVPDCALVRLVFNVAGRECGTNLWFESAVPPITAPSLGTLATRCRVVTGFSYSNVLSSDCQLVRVEAQDWSSGPGLTVTDATPLPNGFGAPTRAASIALSFIHSVPTPIIGHPFRTFLPGIPLSQIIGDQIDSSYANAIANAWNNYAVNLPIFGWRYVAVSRVVGGVPRPVGLVQLITGTIASGLTVSPRRYRLPGRPS